jgi:hypothetical protein
VVAANGDVLSPYVIASIHMLLAEMRRGSFD